MGMSSGMSPGFDMPVGSPMGRSAGMSPAMDISGASPMGMGMASHGAMGSIFGTSPSSSPATGFHDYNLPPSPVPQMGHMSPAMGSPSLGRHSPAMTGLGGGLGDLGQLGSLGSLGSSHPTSDMGGTGFDAFGDVLQPLSTNTPQNQQKQSAGLAKDLDASLVQLAGNLNIKGSNSQIKKTDHQWQPKGEQKLTGGTNFAPRPTSTGPTWNPQFQQQQNMMGGPGQMAQPRMGYGAQGMQMGQPMMGMQQPMGMPNMGMGVGMGMQPPAYGMQQPMGFQQPRPPTQQQNINDPFGAL
ncbi:hypothetical protein LOTGIDRAFT_154795 [Lottia gigantea]|uniref:Uncharacterized protein n=1 Tax=Lottia gigantea TaxID=225164 RepID=V3Z8Q5_LOTGI|nr:hypothetical protein LOTGIDRAFT_154795 [Lottia gigantea]ESO87298.1 hypothetical protein LOTGIDRAFT_154795 [Lottia gigantea]